MKKLTLLLLLIVSTNVLSDWTEIVDNTDLTSYIDFETIKRKGNKVKMWSLFDYKTVQKFKNYRYLSQVSRMEYDCEEETRRQLDFYWYSGNMRQSEIVVSQTNIKDESISVIPGSIDVSFLKVACGKK
jgi:hypothetical protein